MQWLWATDHRYNRRYVWIVRWQRNSNRMAIAVFRPRSYYRPNAHHQLIFLNVRGSSLQNPPVNHPTLNIEHLLVIVLDACQPHLLRGGHYYASRWPLSLPASVA